MDASDLRDTFAESFFQFEIARERGKGLLLEKKEDRLLRVDARDQLAPNWLD